MKIDEPIQQKLLHMTILNLDIDEPIQLWDVKSRYRTIEYLDIEQKIPDSSYNRLAYYYDEFNIEEELDRFVDVKGYEDDYAISQKGTIISKLTNKVLKPKTLNGSRKIEICNRATGHRTLLNINTAVAQHFILNTENHKYVEQIDGNGFNHHVSNQRWIRDNKTKINMRTIIQFDLKGNVVREWPSLNEIIKTLNHCYAPIYACLNYRIVTIASS